MWISIPLGALKNIIKALMELVTPTTQAQTQGFFCSRQGAFHQGPRAETNRRPRRMEAGRTGASLSLAREEELGFVLAEEAF